MTGHSVKIFCLLGTSVQDRTGKRNHRGSGSISSVCYPKGDYKHLLTYLSLSSKERCQRKMDDEELVYSDLRFGTPVSDERTHDRDRRAGKGTRRHETFRKSNRKSDVSLFLCPLGTLPGSSNVTHRL